MSRGLRRGGNRRRRSIAQDVKHAAVAMEIRKPREMSDVPVRTGPAPRGA